MARVSGVPCVLHEDDQLLVVNKPAGWNTHAPAPYAGEGIYDWLRHREPRWASLAIIHRLDKETSGVLVFGKTELANRELSRQFEERSVRKRYLFLTDRPAPKQSVTIRSRIVRAGERYSSQKSGSDGVEAETQFTLQGMEGSHYRVLAEPKTGRTHQIRVHAAEEGFPILGDRLYGGQPAPRVCLHACEITLQHPETQRAVTFSAPADFAADPGLALRQAIIDGAETIAYRLRHGAADGCAGLFIDRLGDWLIAEIEGSLDERRGAEIERLAQRLGTRGAYLKQLRRAVRSTSVQESSPRLFYGQAADPEFAITENGVRYLLRLTEGYSVGLFFDQRDNRRRLLHNHVAAGFPVFADRSRDCSVLNLFAYTCGFSVCAAKAGSAVTSVDLSKKYLEWGRKNFESNGLDPARHEFLYGDAFDWLRRLGKRGAKFDLVILDPPTFSTSKSKGAFRAEHDYGDLVGASLPLVKAGGVIFCSTNAARLAPEAFVAEVQQAFASAERKVMRTHYAPQPPDFPITREEPAHLKTVWARLN